MLDQDRTNPTIGNPTTGIWCKICGITNSQDAEGAQRAGADALGFNLYPPSPRFIALDQAATLAKLTSCQAVAVLVNPTAAEVEQVIDRHCFDLLQFHGDESAEFCRSFGVPYMKAISMLSGVDARHLAATEIESHHQAWAVLLDTYTSDQFGGTGEVFDWSSWPEGAHERLVLAGGLTPQNVAAAIAATNPFGVDLASGVEGLVKGRKDQAKMEQFMKEIRRAKRQ